jgi:hypothetical protein
MRDGRMKVATYGRGSTENQRDTSIADQLRVYGEFAQRQGSVASPSSVALE